MSLSITIDLSDADLAHFQEAVKRAQSNVTAKSPTEITNAAKQLLIDGEGKQVPEFIASRLGKLGSLIAMVLDEGWASMRSGLWRNWPVMRWISGGMVAEKNSV